MLRQIYIRDGEFKGHSYIKQIPWGENWYYDKFGRFPNKDDVIIFSEHDEETNQYSICLGLVIFTAPHITSYGKPIHSFYIAPLRNPNDKKKGEKFVKFLGKTGLAAYSPFWDLSYIRANDNIVLLDSYIFTLKFPHIL